MPIRDLFAIAASLSLVLALPSHAQTLPRGATVIVREGGLLRIPAGQARAGAPALSEVVVAAGGPAIRVRAVAFSPDGKVLASAGAREVVLWDLAGARLWKRLGSGKLDGWVHALAFARDGRSLLVGEGRPGRSGSVRVFDLATGAETAAFSEPKDVVYALALSPDGRLVAAGSADSRVYVWSLAAKKLLTTIREHQGWVLGAAFSPDGRLLATGSADKSVVVWQAGTWKPLQRLHQPDTVQAVAFSPDGKHLAWSVAGTRNRMIRWREPVDRPEEKDRPRKPVAVRTLDTAGATPLALVWGSVPQAKAKQSRLYVASSDRTVKVYGENGGLLGNLTGHGDWVYSVAVSPDGTRFASGSADGTVLLWDGATNRLLGTLVQLTPGRDESLVVAAPGALGAPAPGAKGKAR